MAKSHLMQITGTLGQKYITYYPSMVPDIGLNASIILGKFIYWYGTKGNQSDGYFFKTFKKLYEETGVSYASQKPAIKKLVQLDLISADKYDFRHRRLFKVNMENIRKYAIELSKKPDLNGIKQTSQFNENQPTEKNHTEKSQDRFRERVLNKEKLGVTNIQTMPSDDLRAILKSKKNEMSSRISNDFGYRGQNDPL